MIRRIALLTFLRFESQNAFSHPFTAIEYRKSALAIVERMSPQQINQAMNMIKDDNVTYSFISYSPITSLAAKDVPPLRLLELKDEEE